MLGETGAVESEKVREYLSRRLKEPPATEAVSFLARGEYSLNFLVRREAVARLVTGTQMGLPLDEQAAYEHEALKLLAPSDVTPKPYFVDPEPDGLPYPLILEEYLPGHPLDYATDLAAAARCVAAIHDLGVPEEHNLQVHPDPAPAILEESRGWLSPTWNGAAPWKKAKKPCAPVSGG